MSKGGLCSMRLKILYLKTLGTAEKLAIKEYSASIGKSKDIMEHYIKVLADRGITQVNIWQPSSDGPKDSSEKTDNDDISRSPQTSRIPITDNSTNIEDKDIKHKVKIIARY